MILFKYCIDVINYQYFLTLCVIYMCIYVIVSFLNQMRVSLQLARAWIRIITFIPPKYVCMRVCVCVRPRGHKLLVA